MKEEPKHLLYGYPMSEWIKMVANELPIDAVGMWQIVPGGRHGFGLEGDALTDCVRRCIAELLSRGAVPVLRASMTGSRSRNTAPSPTRSSRTWCASGLPTAPRTRIRAGFGSRFARMPGCRRGREILETG
jgi:hypothetical protein